MKEPEMNKPELKAIVIIPAYNESRSIQRVIQACLPHIPVLVVDDGSKDDTASLAEAQGAVVIRQIPNQGKGAAFRKGFRYCLENGYEVAITLDADGQHDPSEIPLFLEEYQQRHQGLIIGRRDFSQMPFVRKFANSTGKILISSIAGQEIHDNQSGYRLISIPLAKLLLDSTENGFEFEVEMLALCLKHDLGLGWVPIKTIYADQGSHIRPLHHLFEYFRIMGKVKRILHK
jgi:glycosyltransferase involved in cell wall biosynthesis